MISPSIAITTANANIAYGYILYAFKKLKNDDKGALKALSEVWGYITGTKSTLRWPPSMHLFTSNLCCRE